MTVTAMVADRPDLAPVLATLQWEEWGRAEHEPLERWIDIAVSDVGRDRLPVGFVALDGEVLVGGVSIREHDIEERRDRTPWVCGMIVRRDRRGLGVGRLLLGRLDEWASSTRTAEAWVWTATAEPFYRRCGWEPVERLAHEGVDGVLLRRSFPLRASY